MLYRLLLIGLLTLAFCQETKAQVLTPQSDTLKYRALENFSQKSKFTKFLHHLVFRSVAPENAKQHKKRKNKSVKTYSYEKAEGKIIRDIHVITMDPFGYDVRDTASHPGGFFMKSANILHLKTQHAVIKNLLLFKKNNPFDSLLVNESERLVRSQAYIQDVHFSIVHPSSASDSVDLYIRTTDVWSLIPGIGLSNSSNDVGFTDINFAGLGHKVVADTKWNQAKGCQVTRISYLVPNIFNSYINAQVQYSFPGSLELIRNIQFARVVYPQLSSNLQYLSTDNNFLVRGIQVNRSFYSPVVKWAGGLFWGQLITNQSYLQQDSLHNLSSLVNIQDLWAARSWQLFRGSSVDDRVTNLVLSGRLLRARYPDRSTESVTANIFNKETFYLAGLGITSRKYISDSYIFNYGKVEDVPVGRALGITSGIDAGIKRRWYIGLMAAWGNYYSFGYLSTQLEYGTFLRSKGSDQGVATARINYFTHLLELGKWKIRQFIKPTFILGINRLPTDNVSLSQEMKGFDGFVHPATKLLVMTLQTQSYSPWNLAGFHFGPYLFASFAFPGNTNSGFSHNRMYSLLGLGVLIRNDYLMFSTFQLSLSFYPFVPGKGADILRANAFKTSDYGFRDFEISKPGIVDYR